MRFFLPTTMIDLIFTTIASTSIIIYLCYLYNWIVAWQRAETFDGRDERRTPISIVVAMHNEAQVARQLVSSLLDAISPNDRIIIVFDHCTDNTEAVLRQFVSDNLLIVNNPYKNGKKQAQRYGVELAKTEIVVTTDADCVVDKLWLSALDKYQRANNCDMVIMPVRMATDGSLFGNVVELEFAAIQMATASCALMNNSSMCNGANMAFRRDLYLSHDAQTDYISGDDMFLLGSVKQNGGRIGYIKSHDALVTTSVPRGFRNYMKQRTRWLRKSSGYKDEEVLRVAWAMLLGNISWPLLLLCGNIQLSIIIFMLKTVAETLLLFVGRRVFDVKIRPLALILLAVVYPFLILLIAASTFLRSKKEW